jgi:hypothetical protein
VLVLSGAPKGNRTPVFAVKGVTAIGWGMTAGPLTASAATGAMHADRDLIPVADPHRI